MMKSEKEKWKQRKKRQAVNRAYGKCGCGKKRENKTYKTCKTCRNKNKRYREKRKRENKCVCGKKTNNKTLCEICLKKRKEKKIINKASNKCSCGNQLKKGYKRCHVCIQYFKKLKIKNRKNGFCFCGKQKPLYWWQSTCQICLNRNKKWKKKRKNNEKKLYRLATLEEIKKYGKKSNLEILDQYYSLFGYPQNYRGCR